MGAYSLLESLLEQLAAEFPQGEFRAAYGTQGRSRRVEKPTVAGQVAEERWQPEGWRARLEFTLFLPRDTGPGEAEPLLSGIEAAAREASPAFAGVERGRIQADRATGCLAIPCALEFAGGDGADGLEITLGGKTYPAAGWSVAVAAEGRELVSVGESTAFAWEDPRTRYTVEITGIDTMGLERLASFTARLGEAQEEYAGCRWKSLGQNRAVFVSYERRSVE